MNDKAIRCRGLSYAAWGYFFLNFDFNIGTVSILPRFVGFLFLLCAINSLFEERRELLLLRPLCIFLAAFNAINWLLSFVGWKLDGHIIFLDLLIAAVILYFHFQFLTDISVLAQKCLENGEKLAARLRRSRTVYTLLNTGIAIITAVPATVWSDYGRTYSSNQRDVLYLFGLAQGVTAVVIMVTLFGLKKRFQGVLYGQETSF